ISPKSTKRNILAHRHEYRNLQTSATPIHAKIAVERKNLTTWIELGHANQTRVGQRHGNGSVSRDEGAERKQLGINAKRDLQHASGHKVEHRLGAAAVLAHEMARLGEHRLACQKRRSDTIECC